MVGVWGERKEEAGMTVTGDGTGKPVSLVSASGWPACSRLWGPDGEGTECTLMWKTGREPVQKQEHWSCLEEAKGFVDAEKRKSPSQNRRPGD